MNRGRSREVVSDDGYHRFNEAPIHESGKRYELQAIPARLGSFNEAPIHESGKAVGKAIRGQLARLQ